MPFNAPPTCCSPAVDLPPTVVPSTTSSWGYGAQQTNARFDSLDGVPAAWLTWRMGGTGRFNPPMRRVHHLGIMFTDATTTRNRSEQAFNRPNGRSPPRLAPCCVHRPGHRSPRLKGKRVMVGRKRLAGVPLAPARHPATTVVAVSCLCRQTVYRHQPPHLSQFDGGARRWCKTAQVDLLMVFPPALTWLLHPAPMRRASPSPSRSRCSIVRPDHSACRRGA